MGRPMRPIDPADGTLQAFAAELRQLRERAGSPPFRLMARRAHYSATTLSVACGGTSLPSLEVTIAFVRACDGPADYWRQRWQDAAAAALPAGRRLAGSGDDPADPGRAPLNAGRAVLRFRRPLALAAVIAAASAAGAAAWSLAHPAAAAGPADGPRALRRRLAVRCRCRDSQSGRRDPAGPGPNRRA